MSDKAGFDEDSLIDIRDIRMDDEVASPATPAAGQKKIFVKSDELKQLNSSGVERFVGDKVTVSSTDTTSNYIVNKLIAGTGVTLTKLNPGANETYEWKVNNAVGSSRFACICGAVGATSNKYLEFFRSVSSDDSPFIIAETSEIVALSVAAKNVTTATFSIKKNGVEVDTIVLTSQQTNYKASLAHALVPGNALSVNMISGSATDPVLTIFTKVLL